MEITKREVIASVVIAAIMLILGFFISGKITDYESDKNAEYQKAIHIEDTDMFQYGMDTNVGNAFVYGDLKAVDSVTFDEIGGDYLYIEKTEEHYKKHTRTVTKTKTVNGKTKTYTEKETYWSWDYYDSWEKSSKTLSFCSVEFPVGKISLPGSSYIDTLDGSYHVRYVYRGIKSKHTGTVYTHLKDGTITDNSPFYENTNIEEALERCTSGGSSIAFWIFWIGLTGAIMYGFYYFENKWLED